MSSTTTLQAPRAATFQEAASFHQALQDLLRLHLARDRDRLSFYGITLSGARAVETLVRLGPLSLNRLATELFVDKSTASRIVGCLEERGLVRRDTAPGDRRVLRLVLTAEGRTLAAQLTDDAVWEMHVLLGTFAPDARREMLAFLRQLTRISAAHAGVTDAACCRSDSGDGCPVGTG